MEECYIKINIVFIQITTDLQLYTSVLHNQPRVCVRKMKLRLQIHLAVFIYIQEVLIANCT